MFSFLKIVFNYVFCLLERVIIIWRNLLYGSYFYVDIENIIDVLYIVFYFIFLLNN